jgi:hypothetical protein
VVPLGTYGVVTSVVVKAYPKITKMTILKFDLDSSTIGVETFWKAMKAYFSYFPQWSDTGAYHYWFLFNRGGTFAFNLNPWFAPNLSKDEVLKIAAPWIADLEALGIPFTPNITEYDNFYDMWWQNFPLETVGTPNVKTSSRLFPRTNFLDKAKFGPMFDALRWTSETMGRTMLGYCIAGQPPDGKHPDNAVNPAWRATSSHIITAVSWDDNTPLKERSEQAKLLTGTIMERWREVSPGAGAYMNEADTSEPDFQQSFYGAEFYPRLYKLKQEYDPEGVFYAHTAVGSEDWYITDQDPNIPTQNGRLCRKG